MTNLIQFQSSSDTPWYKQPQMVGRLTIFGIISLVAYFFGVQLLTGAMAFFGFIWFSILSLLSIGAAFYFSGHVITLFEVASWKISDFFIKCDPITIAKVRLSRAWKKLQGIVPAIDILKGQRINDSKTLHDNQNKIEENLKIVKFISEKDDPTDEEKYQVNILVEEARSLKEWNEQIIPLLETTTTLEEGMRVIYQAGKNKLEVEGAKLTILEKRFESVNVSWSAITRAKGIFGGDPGKRNEFELAITEANKQISQKMASIDSFMEMTRPLLSRAALNDKMANEDVKHIIEKIKTGQFDKMIEDFKSDKLKITTTPSSTPSLDKAASYAKKPSNDYENLLNENNN